MNTAIDPPALQPVRTGRRSVGRLGYRAEDILAQHIENLGDADQDRDPPRVDLPDDLMRVVAAHEDDNTRQHRRDECRHRLSEHMAEREKVQKANRLERLGVFLVLLHLALDRHDVGENVPVLDDYAFRFRRRAGGE